MTTKVVTKSVGDAVAMLDDEFHSFNLGFRSGRYALWVGSGISRGVAPDVRKLLLKLLDFLHRQIDAGDPTGRYAQARSEVFRRADLDIQTELTTAELLLPPDQWKNVSDLLYKFQNSYSEILDIRIPDMDDDHLLWDGTDFVNTFVSGARPDTEHLCLAVLLMEGVVTDVVSANWDNFIEAAISEISAGNWNELGVKVLPSDFRQTPTTARLYKFHGCAVSAKENPPVYRPYLVGRKEQITGWVYDRTRNATMQRELVRLAVSQRTLMIGLSAQDADIQAIFSDASHDQVWEWPATPPALVFAEESLGGFQEDVLKSAYRGSYTANVSEINESSHFSAYGKPLLTALVLSTLTDKLREALVLGLEHSLPLPELDSLAAELVQLRTRIADYCREGRKDRVSTFIHSFAQLTAVSRRGAVGPRPAPGYLPYSVAPAHRTAVDPTLMTGGNPQLALALAILSKGHSANEWEVTFDKLRRDGALTVSKGNSAAHTVVVANENAMIEAVKNGIVDLGNPNMVLISGLSIAADRQRTPKSAPGRSRNAGARIVSLSRLLEQADSADSLHKLFRQGAAL